MILTQPKSRVVFFRITPEEYETLQNLCLASGARSISDLSRLAVAQYVARSLRPKKDPLEREVQRLRTQIQDLAASVKELSMLLKRCVPSDGANENRGE